MDRCFAAAGHTLVHDHRLVDGSLAVTLDGFDLTHRVGYLYVSHADADVVTDVDAATLLALRVRDATGVAHILVVHDHEIVDADDLAARASEFLARP
jgi:hypothetical protein